MAIITGTSGNDSILPSGVSAGVTGGVPTTANDTIIGSFGSDTIDGGATNQNTLDYSAFALTLGITFGGYSFGTVVKALETDTFTNIHRVFAGSGNDSLTGTTASGTLAMWLRGNAGNDFINGQGNRSNTADYSNSPAAVTIDLGAGTASDGWGGTDTLVNVRRVALTIYNDTATGGSFGDVFYIPTIQGTKTLDGAGASDRGNEVRYASSTGLLADLGTTAAAGGGFTGTIIKSNGLIDSITRITRFVGGSGADTVTGTTGDDVVEGEAGNDLIVGRSGFDFVGYGSFTASPAPSGGVVANLTTGQATDAYGGIDTLIDIEGVFGGGFGDDLTGRDLGFASRSFLQGGGGADTLRGALTGFTGADYTGDGNAVTVNLEFGTATDGSGATDTLVNINSARGSGFNDSIVGNFGDDWLSGGNGNDVINGGDGDDRVLGDGGNDTLSGGSGVDVITGGAGQDSLTGGLGGDRFNFTLTATLGDHSSRATQDNITDFSVAEGDYIRLSTSGAARPDVIYAGQVAGTYAALNSDIVLPGFAAPAGINALNAYTIAHTSLGGWVVVDENSDGILQSNEFAVRLASSIADMTQVRVNGSSLVTQIGDGTSNTIFITEGVAGGARGLDGDDVIYGGGSFDNMGGGQGNDQFVVRNRDTVLYENAGEGEDTAWVTVDRFTNGANIEVVRMSGSAQRLEGSATAEQIVANGGLASALFGNGGNDVLWSTGLADTLDGGDGDDIIRGQGGADSMYGGLGNDSFVVFDAAAQVFEYLNGGYDVVYVASASFTLGDNIEEGRLSAAGAVQLNGGNTAENLVANQGEASTLNGNGGNDVLWGSGFADAMNGGAGDDILRGQGGADVMNGGAGNDQYVLFSSAGSITDAAGQGYDIAYLAGTGTYVIAAEIEEIRLYDTVGGLTYNGPAANKLIVGNQGGTANNISAGAGNDTIYGAAGNDTLLGGSGNDTLYFGGGADRLVVGIPNSGIDQVAGFATADGAKFQFLSGSGITSFGQLGISSAGGNTQVNFNGQSVLFFGVATMTADDFIFG